MEKKEKYYQTRLVRLKTSKLFWKKFDNWWRDQGCTTRAAGLRLAMRIAVGGKEK